MVWYSNLGSLRKGVSEFENDVIWYGTQTAAVSGMIWKRFENDVIWYGTQTLSLPRKMACTFENDVIWYGTQTLKR